jgi:hypothetical protein
MRGVALLIVVLAAAGVAQAAASPKDPRVALRPADNALAKRVTVRPADVGGGARNEPGTGGVEQLRCPPYYDPNYRDLVVTGRRESLVTRGEAVFVGTGVEVYSRAASARASFTRGNVASVTRCLGESFSDTGVTASAARLGFPRVGDRSAAFRITMRGSGGTVYADAIVFQRGRTVVSLVCMSLAGPYPRADAVRIARRVAARAR